MNLLLTGKIILIFLFPLISTLQSHIPLYVQQLYWLNLTDEINMGHSWPTFSFLCINCMKQMLHYKCSCDSYTPQIQQWNAVHIQTKNRTVQSSNRSSCICVCVVNCPLAQNININHLHAAVHSPWIMHSHDFAKCCALQQSIPLYDLNKIHSDAETWWKKDRMLEKVRSECTLLICRSLEL